MIPTQQPLITLDRIGQSFIYGPNETIWSIMDVNEETRMVRLRLRGTRDTIWMGDHFVHDMIEDYHENFDFLLR